MKGLFITFEGCDGLGKSGQVHLLVDELNRRGHKVWTTKEPGNGLPGGGSPFGPLVRDADRLDRLCLKCSHCPPHKRENAKRQPHPDRYKSHRWNFQVRVSNG